MLKASARNCKLHFSLMLNFLNNEMSTLVRPGPIRELRPAFPKVPASGIENALGSNHCSAFPRITGPLKLGFQLGTSGFWVSPVPELLEPTVGVKGKPLWTFRIPFHCQPPISFSTHP